MPGPDLDYQILEKLGNVQHELGVVKAQNAQIIAEQAKASLMREEMDRKLSEVAVLQAEVNRLTPIVNKHEERYQRSVGISTVGAAAMTTFGGVIGAIAAFILKNFGSNPSH